METFRGDSQQKQELQLHIPQQISPAMQKSPTLIGKKKEKAST